MERLSAEGFFFHRECFRCVVCSCTLRLGGHAFDSREGASHRLSSAACVFGLFSPELVAPVLEIGIVLIAQLTDCYIFFTAKFYCKIHYAQRQTSSHMGRIRRLVRTFQATALTTCLPNYLPTYLINYLPILLTTHITYSLHCCCRITTRLCCFSSNKLVCLLV